MYKLLYSFPDTHAIVQFLDKDTTAVVPTTRLKEQEHGALVHCYMERQEAVEQSPLLCCM